MNQPTTLDRDYLDFRCMLLEMAAILDRHDRAAREHNKARTFDQHFPHIGQVMEIRP